MPLRQYDVAATALGEVDGTVYIRVTWKLGTTYTMQQLQFRIPYERDWTYFDTKMDGDRVTYDVPVVWNKVYQFRVRGYINIIGWYYWSDPSNYCSSGTEIGTGELLFSGKSTDIISGDAFEHGEDASLEFEGYSLEAQSLATTYAYYLASATGAVYEYAEDYTTDAGTAIPSLWRSKETNFTDQFKELESRQKNVHGIRLYYVDKDADVAVSIKASTDGGATWVGVATKTIGTGDGTAKSTDFYFDGGPVSGQFFTFLIASATDARLQWTALAVYFEPGGEDK